MHEPAKRDPAAIAIVLALLYWLLVVLLIVGIRIAPQQPGGESDCKRSRGAEHDAGYNAAATAKRHMKQQNRQAEDRIADHSAKSARQRPMRAARQARGRGGGEHGADRPQHHA